MGYNAKITAWQIGNRHRVNGGGGAVSFGLGYDHPVLGIFGQHQHELGYDGDGCELEPDLWRCRVCCLDRW